MMKLLPLIIVALLAGPAMAQPAPAPLVGTQLTIALPDQSGRTVSLTDRRYRGKVVIITISGSWCANCHDEARFLVPWAARRGREGVEVISLHFEYPDDPAHARQLIGHFARRHGIKWPLLLAGRPSRQSIATALGGRGDIHSLPSTIILGRDGRVRHVHTGLADEKTGEVTAGKQTEFDALISRLLAEAA